MGGTGAPKDGQYSGGSLSPVKEEPMADMLLVGSKTKEALKANGCNVGGDALPALNMVVHWYVEQAAKRAAANGRKTVRAHDFMIG